MEPLPHVYPFRFADRTVEKTGPGAGRVRASVTANARRFETTGGAADEPFGLPVLTLAELIAQSALLLQGGDPELGRSGFLAGFGDFQVDRPPRAGELLTIDVAIAGRLGPVVKFDGTITGDEGARVARGTVTVRQGDSPPV